MSEVGGESAVVGLEGENSVLALEARHVRKAYSGVLALKGVDLSVRQGEVHALVGENGAGKSTLVKIIAGAQAPDSGRLTVGGRAISTFDPRVARASGIAVIHQERQIAPDLTVAENVLMGRLPGSRLGTVRWREAIEMVSATLDSLGLDLNPRARADSLTPPQAQLVEAARALCIGADVVVMDEPTSSLTADDAGQLMNIVRRLRASGASVLYVSHRLGEILDLADRITVLRDGAVVDVVDRDAVDVRSLGEMIVGRPLPERRSAAKARAVEQRTPVLEIRDVVAPNLGPVTLTVHKGEIVCVAGAIGSGRRELARIAAGAQRPIAGTVTVAGRSAKSPRQMVQSGLVFLPDDRKNEAILPGRSVVENISLGSIVTSRRPGRAPRQEWRAAAKTAIGVGLDPHRLASFIDNLSGGNQQKALIARWASVGAFVYVLDEPTAGVDVGARAEIYDLLRAQVVAGASVLCFSSDLDEISEIADRVVVLRDGQITGEAYAGEFENDDIFAMQIGLN